jgi:hypothetical protein
MEDVVSGILSYAVPSVAFFQFFHPSGLLLSSLTQGVFTWNHNLDFVLILQSASKSAGHAYLLCILSYSKVSFNWLIKM